MSLATATCALLGTSATPPVNAQEEPTWEFNTALLYYGESDDRVEDISLNVFAQRNFVDDRILTLGLTVDSLTGATPIGAMPFNESQTFTTPFVNRKGQMTWPTDGRLLRKFGESKADGRLRWDGVLLATGAGSEVLAVHHGRVVYSDWLPGMGLLVVLEHGDGYLTLYGHNQDLIMEVGEWVTPGTVIAHVGDSGGQPVPGLYFEIRKNGAPVNPSHWVGK